MQNLLKKENQNFSVYLTYTEYINSFGDFNMQEEIKPFLVN